MMAGSPGSIPERPRFSVVVPTFERRDLVCAGVRALARQRFDGPFEVIVVVDGSTDGTAEALRRLATPFGLEVLEQPNCGAATARARGAERARGEILLFLDDDMEAHPDLLDVHDRAHREGADVVLGHMPLHPESPRNFLSAGVGRWMEDRRAALSASPEAVDRSQILTGQLSMSRAAFDRAGGFDTSFNRGGTYGKEDVELGLRLARDGCRIVFRPAAISWQRYVVTPRRYLRQYEQAGSAAVALARKHPDEAERLFTSRRPETRLERWSFALLGPLWREVVLASLAFGAPSPRRERWFYRLSDLGFWRGVRRAGGIPHRRPLRVLAYHAVRDLRGAKLLAEYGVPPRRLRAHLRLLARCGFRFVDQAELLRYLRDGAGLPKRPLLVTFDDAYAELPKEALPVLREVGASAVVFAVSSLTGGSNDWDRALGAPELALCDAEALRGLERAGLAVGSHTRHHFPLTVLGDDDLERELRGSAEELEAMGIRRPRLLAYPHGEADGRVRAAAARAGYDAAFTVEAGLVAPGDDAWRLARIEVLRRDTGLRFLAKVLLAGRDWRSFFTMMRFWFRELGRTPR